MDEKTKSIMYLTIAIALLLLTIYVACKVELITSHESSASLLGFIISLR